MALPGFFVAVAGILALGTAVHFFDYSEYLLQAQLVRFYDFWCMLMMRKCFDMLVMRRIIPSDPQTAFFILPMIRIQIFFFRNILSDMKLAIIYKNGFKF
jgi:hypothetical protein